MSFKNPNKLKKKKSIVKKVTKQSNNTNQNAISKKSNEKS